MSKLIIVVNKNILGSYKYFYGALELVRGRLNRRENFVAIEMLMRITKYFKYLLGLASAVIPSAVFADDYGATATKNVGGDLINLRGTASQTIREVAGELVGTVLSFLGIVFFGLMLYAGFMWMTSMGNDSKVKTARQLMVAAVIGLIIISAAYAITAFIGDSLPQ